MSTAWRHTAAGTHGSQTQVKEDPKARCKLKGEDGVKAKRACPLACGGCDAGQSADDPFYEYQPGKDCKHVAELPEKRCARNYGKTAEACCATCKDIKVEMYATGDVVNGAGTYVPWSIVLVTVALTVVAAVTFNRKASGVDEKEPLLHRPSICGLSY